VTETGAERSWYPLSFRRTVWLPAARPGIVVGDMPRWTPSIETDAPAGVVVTDNDPLPGGTDPTTAGEVAAGTEEVATGMAVVGTAVVVTGTVVTVVVTAAVVVVTVVGTVVVGMVVVGTVVVIADRVWWT
jgi:hypothetical protein